MRIVKKEYGPEPITIGMKPITMTVSVLTGGSLPLIKAARTKMITPTNISKNPIRNIL